MSAQAGKNKSAQPTLSFNNRFAIIIYHYIAALVLRRFFRNFRSTLLSLKKRRVFLAKAPKHKILWSIA
jgi:hypothetical protein